MAVFGWALAKYSKKSLDNFCCFAAGTKVKTIDGHKNIEDLELGDLVLSKIVETGEVAYKPVSKLFNKYRGIYELIVKNSSGTEIRIKTKDDHPFDVKGEGFKAAYLLNGQDRLVNSLGDEFSVVSIANTRLPEQTYNIEVADFHTYFAIEYDLWVHNACDPATIVTYGNNTLVKLRKHSQHKRETARKHGIEIPKGPGKPETVQAMKGYIRKVVNEAPKKAENT